MKPGKWISVAGDSVIRQSQFISASSDGKYGKVHCLYFDRIDVLAGDLSGDGSLATVEEILLRMERVNTKILDELKKQSRKVD